MNRTPILIACFFAACTSRNNIKFVTANEFDFPVIIHQQNTDTIKAFSIEQINEFYPPLIGKFKFGDTIDFSNISKERLSEAEYLWEVRNSTESDSMSSDGLRILPDYNTSIVYSKYDYPKGLYFPVYVINETRETKIFFGKDEYGFAVQEAIDTADFSSWHPIESQGFAFCGNGGFRKKIKPKEFLLFLMPKYDGPEITSLRIRFQIGESVFISKAYQGTINSKQFSISNDSWLFRTLKESKGYASSYLFYGGKPKGNWD